MSIMRSIKQLLKDKNPALLPKFLGVTGGLIILYYSVPWIIAGVIVDYKGYDYNDWNTWLGLIIVIFLPALPPIIGGLQSPKRPIIGALLMFIGATLFFGIGTASIGGRAFNPVYFTSMLLSAIGGILAIMRAKRIRRHPITN